MKSSRAFGHEASRTQLPLWVRKTEAAPNASEVRSYLKNMLWNISEANSLAPVSRTAPLPTWLGAPANQIAGAVSAGQELSALFDEVLSFAGGRLR
jgi:hypothetical protein